MTTPNRDWVRDLRPLKAPFDPLTSGWVRCGCRWERHPTWADPVCPTCDGTGYRIGEPADGIRILPWLGHALWPHAVQVVVDRNRSK